MRPFPNLRTLRIEGIPIDEAAIRTIQALPKLEHISLSDPTPDHKFAQALADARPNLSVGVITGGEYKQIHARQP